MSSQIDVDKIVSFDGSQTELSELCKDDKILEGMLSYYVSLCPASGCLF